MAGENLQKTSALMGQGLKTVIPSYAPSLVLSHGKGVWVWDTDGKQYIDFLAGIAVNILGHCHPHYVQRVQAQLETLLQVSNLFFSEPQIQLQEELTRRSFADRVYFCNSGAEANEAALKLARRYQSVVAASGRYEVIAMKHSFHGRTMGALTATGQPKYHKGFKPLVPGFVYGEFNQLDDVKGLITPQTAAIIVEPVQGEGGVLPAKQEFLSGLRAICDEEGIILVFDEVQTGLGRTGKLFAYEHYGVEPDIITLAKGLGGGIPVGAMMCREEIAHGFVKGSHATTFGGNPVVATAGLAVLEVLDEADLLKNCDAMGAHLRKGLESLSSQHDQLGEVRGLGMMLALEYAGDSAALMSQSRECGLLHNTAGGGAVLRFLPPLVICKEEIDEGLSRLEKALHSVL